MKTKKIILLLVLWLLFGCLVVLNMLHGDYALNWSEIAQQLYHGQFTGEEMTVLLELRLPRVLAAILCGSLLGFSGAALQGWLRNPLADPGVLGVSGGASLGALICMMLGVGMLGQLLGALVGALSILIILFVVIGIAVNRKSDDVPRLLVLVGAMLGAIEAAFMTLVLMLTDTQSLRGVLFWLMGDLSSPQAVVEFCGVGVIVIVMGCMLAMRLNVLQLGHLAAQSLGISLTATNILLLCCVACACAVVVLCAGPIAWVGFIVPHILRYFIGLDWRWLLPLSALMGANLLLGADLLARVLFAPSVLPVGVITALLGAPLLLVLLLRGRHA